MIILNIIIRFKCNNIRMSINSVSPQFNRVPPRLDDDYTENDITYVDMVDVQNKAKEQLCRSLAEDLVHNMNIPLVEKLLKDNDSNHELVIELLKDIHLFGVEEMVDRAEYPIVGKILDEYHWNSEEVIDIMKSLEFEGGVWEVCETTQNSDYCFFQENRSIMTEKEFTEHCIKTLHWTQRFSESGTILYQQDDFFIMRVKDTSVDYVKSVDIIARFVYRH
jgi:hypothetical protein